MPFDFPASPAIGDTSNGYVFNGTGWAGGAQAGPVTEQFFNLVGLSQLDIPVPSWAKGVQLIGSMFVPSNSQPSLRLSFDGTTFLAGASDYYWTGPYHQTGSSGYAASVATATGAMLLLPSGSDTTIPQQFTAELNLTKPTATSTSIFAAKSYGHAHDPAATYLNRTSWWQTWMSTGAQGANTAIKALRFFTYTGAIIVDGWLKLKWLGNSAEIPQSNAVGEAPQDGRAFHRQSAAWVDAAVPTLTAGVGQWVTLAANGVALNLPAGGTWAHFVGSSNTGTGGITSAFSGGVNAGGTLLRGAAANTYHQGFAWRLA